MANIFQWSKIQQIWITYVSKKVSNQDNNGSKNSTSREQYGHKAWKLLQERTWATNV